MTILRKKLIALLKKLLSGDVKIKSGSDADFAADKAERKSVSGCVVMKDSAVVFWSCKKPTGSHEAQ